MCQMTIHAHAQTTTMLQALEHNLRTSIADVDTLAPILAARTGEPSMAHELDSVRLWVLRSADLLHRLFEDAVAAHPHVDGQCTDHPDHGPHGPAGVSVAATEHIHA